MRRGLIVVPAGRAQESQRHEARPQQYREANPERGGDDQAGMDLARAPGHEHNPNRGHDDRQQGEQTENAPEAAHQRMARAGRAVRIGHGFPLVA